MASLRERWRTSCSSAESIWIKNVITRIETNKRYVTDLELRAIVSIFQVSYDYLIDGNMRGKI